MNTPRADYTDQLRLLRLSEVENISGLKKSKIYALIQDRLFPRPYKLGRCSRWSSVEVLLWMTKTCRH